jgi:hypothetical protein
MTVLAVITILVGALQAAAGSSCSPRSAVARATSHDPGRI